MLLTHLAAVLLSASSAESRVDVASSGSVVGVVLRARAGLVLHQGASQGQERRIDVRCRLGRGLNEWDAERLGECVRSLLRDLLLLHQVSLVADEELQGVLSRVTVDLCEPLLHVVEGLTVGDVIDKNNTVSTTVIGGSDGTEALLTSSIPNLKLHCLAINVYCTEAEINTDRGDV